MQVLPVLDLLDGIVVRGVGGKRDEYRPVASRLVSQADPLSVARAFRDQLGLTRLYIADLDAILRRKPNLDIYRSLSREGFELLVDAGLRDVEAARSVMNAGASHLIAGLETLPAPEELAELVETFGTDRVIFSLDLKGGSALGELHRWNTADPCQIGIRAVHAGVSKMIVLDLAQVGGLSGISTLGLCRDLRAQCGNLKLITGGGIRDRSDLLQLEATGIDAVLVASSLHDGRIVRADVEALQKV